MRIPEGLVNNVAMKFLSTLIQKREKPQAVNAESDFRSESRIFQQEHDQTLGRTSGVLSSTVAVIFSSLQVESSLLVKNVSHTVGITAFSVRK
jgi:hypothetical protein